MRTLIIFLSFTLTAIQASCQEKKPTNYIEKDLDALFKQMILDENAIGASAAYSINDETIWLSAQGFSDKENNKAFKKETKVRMASIAKSMTAIAVMQLVEHNLIDIDKPIQTYITDFPKQPKTQITTRHLLSHTSGLAGYKNWKEAETKINYPSLADAVDFFKNRPLLFEPGTKYSYTSYGYTVIGLIIEKITGASYESYMQKNIWDKAGMTSTGIDVYGVQEENASKLYSKNRRGTLKEGKENNLSNRIPGGGFYTIVEDMLKFGNAVIANRLIKKETLSLMRKHHSLEKDRNSYGFGWFLYAAKPDVGDVIGHSGGQMGCSSQLLIVPEEGIVTVVLANTSRASRVTGFAVELLQTARDTLKNSDSQE